MSRINAKLVKTGEHLVIYADNRFEALQAAKMLAHRGAKILSDVRPLGNQWVITVEDIRERVNAVQVLRFGGNRMIKGANRGGVIRKLQELIASGANIVQKPTQASGGEWVAVCDSSCDVYKW